MEAYRAFALDEVVQRQRSKSRSKYLGVEPASQLPRKHTERS